MSAREQRWMKRAVAAGRRGLGATYPNPCVGVVVAKGDTMLASARTRPTGGPHAEAAVLSRLGRAARGATMYVTLEPCRHHGRTPPCTDAIVAAGIVRVVVGIVDPAAHVRGKGIAALRRAGVAVTLGVGKAACTRLHEHYLHHVTTGQPFVTLKAAISVDGRIATASGDSRWITSVASRRHVHRQRAEHHGIIVGATTVLADNPRLNVRLARGVSPIPIVFDPQLRLGRAAVQARALLRAPTMIVHTRSAPAAARRRLTAAGVTLVQVAAAPGGVSIPAALRALGRASVRSVLVEGGGRLHGAFIKAGAWQRWLLYQAPRVLGEGIAVVRGVDWPTVAEAPVVRVMARRNLGPDQLLVLEPAMDR